MEEDDDDLNQEDLAQIFVGKKFEELYNKNFSLWSLLFGPIYFIYRKMIFIGLLLLIVDSFIGCWFSYLNKALIVFVYLLLRLAYSLLFNSVYRSFVEKKVKKIYEYAESDEETIELCEKKGKPSILIVLLFIIIYTGLTILFSTYINSLIIKNRNNNSIKNDSEIVSEEELENKIILDGSTYTKSSSYDLTDYITYELDEIFEEDDSEEGVFKYKDEEAEADELNSVFFQIDGFDEIEDNTDGLFQSKEATIGENTWTVLTYEDEYSTETTYAYTKVNDIYVFVIYEIEGNVVNKDQAKIYFYDILNSVEAND